MEEDKLVLATTEGVVTLAELEACLDAVLIAGGLPYRKLFDLTRGTFQLSDADIMSLGARINAYATVDTLGSLAIAARSDETYDLAQRFLNLTLGKRDARLFRSMTEARRWLVVLPDKN